MQEQFDASGINPKAPNPMGWIPLKVMTAATAPASDTKTIAQQIADYTKWNEWLVSGAGLIETMDAVLIKTLNDPAALTAINAACHSFYDAAQGMNKEIVRAITKLNKKPPEQPTVKFGPSSLPDWPDTSKPNLFSSVWDVAKPLLQMLDQKLVASHPDAPIVVALGGLIDAGDNIVKTLSTYYPAWGPQPSNSVT